MIMLKKLEDAIKELEREKDLLLDKIQKATWIDDRPNTRIPERTRSTMPSMDFEETVPEEAALPNDANYLYQQWYGSIQAIISNNQPDRLKEIEKHYLEYISPKINRVHITKREEFEVIDHINSQFSILAAIPSFLKYSIYDIELTAYSIIMDDEIEASRHLLANGFLRPAGALAGVILERYLKNLLRKHSPPIKYPERSTLGNINELCKKNSIINHETWSRIQYITSLRNLCDHDKEREPSQEEVRDLINGVYAIIKDVTLATR